MIIAFTSDEVLKILTDKALEICLKSDILEPFKSEVRACQAGEFILEIHTKRVSE